MIRRQNSATPRDSLQVCHSSLFPRPYLSAAQLRKAARLRHKIECLKQELAQMLAIQSRLE